MDPGVEQRPRWTTKLAALALFSCALVIVVATLFVPEHAGSRAEAEHLGFGYPLHFVEEDVTIFWSAPSTWSYDPHHVAGHVRPIEFLLDWAIVAAALAAPSWLGRRRRS